MSSGTEALTGLRNERKPCHFWVDNEVADCYQPIVGADAIWVYCRIARNARGAWIVSPKVRGGDTRVSLREMADWCGKSVDTVWRCLQVLERVGLLQAECGAKSKGRYALADVKDLVTREGGTYDREMGSFQLPAQRAAELKGQVRELRLKMARKSGAKLRVVEPIGPGQSVAQSDRLDGGLFSTSVAQSDKTVALDIQICRSGSTASITTRKQESKTNYPLPPQAGVSGAQQTLTDAEAYEATVDQVMRGCGFTARRMRSVLCDVLRQEADESEQPLVMALSLAMVAMVEAWEDFTSQGARLRFKWGARRFFAEGYWRNRESWPWDNDALKQERMAMEARVGSR